MLTLLFSPDWVAGRDAILKLIAQDVQNEKAGCILMVPELISHDMERRLCAVAGDTASRFAEVLSFTRLAHRVDEALGNGSPDFLEDAHSGCGNRFPGRHLQCTLAHCSGHSCRPVHL